MTTLSFHNPLVNILNDSSSVYYDYFNRNSQNSQAKIWINDDKHYNNKKCSHYCRRGHTIDECYRLHGFSLNYKRRNIFVHNIAMKTANESETPTNQE